MLLYRLRWLIVVGWVAVVCAAAPLALHVTRHLTSEGFDDPRGSAAWADAQLARLPRGPSGPTVSTLVEGLTAARVTAIWDAAAATEGATPADAVVTALAGHPTDVVVDVLPGPASDAAAQAFTAALATTPGVHSRAVDMGAAGDGVVSAAMDTLARAGYIALPFLAILLLLVYDSVVAALLPFVVGLVGTLLALGVISLLEPYMQLSVYLTNIVSFLALGVGIDYSLFISTRFRTALREQGRQSGGGGVAAAIALAMRTSGRSVFFSGLAVGASMLALLLPRTAYWSGLAVGGCVAVFAVLVATMTLLPAALAILGWASEWGRIPRPASLGTLWPRAARFLTGNPWPVLGVGVLLLALPAVASPGISVSTPANVATMLAPTSPLRLAVEQQQRDYGPGTIAPLPIALQAPGLLTDPATWQVVADLTATLQAMPQVASVASPVAGASPAALAAVFAAPQGPPPALAGAVAQPDLIVLSVTSKFGPDDPRTQTLLTQMNTALSALPAGWRGATGGAVALLESFNALVRQTLPEMVLVVAAVAFVVLFAASGSLWVALLAVVFDGLVALSTAGILVLIVQHGRAGFEALPLDSSITPLIFVVLFGLSMDYEVILIHRIREYAAAGHAPRAAAERGIAETGGMITGAGLIMVVVFAAMLLSPLQLMRTMALGMAVAILLDTWIVRTCLVPSSITLLGRRGWWPFGPRAVDSALAAEGQAAD